MLELISELIAGAKQKTLASSSLEDQVYNRLGEEYARLGGYPAFAAVIEALCREGTLQAVKASRSNGRTPALSNRYRKVSGVLSEESLGKLLGMHPLIKSEAYRKFPQTFTEDEAYLKALDAFLKNPGLKASLEQGISANERSFQIFRDEKFLLSSQGRTFLQRVGLNLEDLSCYVTCEPFFYVDYRQVSPSEQSSSLPGVPVAHTALIVENKDTFHSIKRAWRAGGRRLGEQDFDLLIYGEGRKIVSSFAFVEDIQGISPENLRVLYFGDLDPEGLDIFGALATAFPDYRIEPLVFCYEALWRLYGHAAPLRRETEQKLHPDYEGKFLEFFPQTLRSEIKSLLAQKRYIPQEGLSYLFFSRSGEVSLWEKN
ncbi:hypothetical protein CEB3_c36230 [Peptococcaceae bacterium CEB3]|nr:hypothetical protein CEB3_c36230 [Peptococcaceae bacterium CEB3]